MHGHLKKIGEIAKSEMSRNALNRWRAFELPARSETIDEKLAELARLTDKSWGTEGPEA